MPTLPSFRQLAAQSTDERRALSTVDSAAIARAKARLEEFRLSGTVKDINGRSVTIQARDVRALLTGERFKFVKRQGHYLNASGGIVPDASIKAGAESIVGNTLARTANLITSLRQGDITATQWLLEMGQTILENEIGQTVLARGGYGGLSPPEVRERISNRVFEQLDGNKKFPGLYAFAKDIKAGRYGTAQLANLATNRALLYPQSGRISYELEFAQTKFDAGFDEVCRLLAAVNHCDSCAEEAAKGWVPQSEAVPIGNDLCGPGCHCTQIFRRAGQESGPEVQKAIQRAQTQAEQMRQIKAERMKTDDE